MATWCRSRSRFGRCSLAGGLLIAACSRAPETPLLQARFADEAAVQSAVVNQFAEAGVRQIVVLDSTVMGADHFVEQDYAGGLRQLGVLAPGLREDFNRKRLDKVKVGDVRARVPIAFVSQREVADVRRDARTPDDYWRNFRARYPGAFGRISLSRVGFSSDGNKALVLADYGCGPRCGGTRYYLLERSAGGWRILRVAQPRIV